MKKVLAILVIAVLSFQSLAKIAVLGFYLLNKEYIAKELCINRDKPHMKCNGKCHLNMQLKEQEEQEQKLPSGFYEKTEIPVFIHPFPLTIPVTEGTFVKVVSAYSSAELPGIATSIFHPPKSNLNS